MFEKGDAVVCPAHGAGIVKGFSELKPLDGAQRYYQIELVKQVNTHVMIPVDSAEEQGVRPAITDEELYQVWEVLSDDPKDLPPKHRTRYKVINDKFDSGSIIELAEAIRDMAWRRREEDGLTKKGRRIYRRGLDLLAGEVAVAQGVKLETAKSRISKKLRKYLS